MIDLNQKTFQTEVIDTSHDIPVLVDFWADWCAPCKMLAPVLEKLAAEYQGQLRIAKVNTDEQRGLAEQHGIRSLPTLRLYRNGEAVEEVLGAQPESVLRQLIEAYLVRPSDQGLQAALALAASGERRQAIEQIEQLLQDDTDNTRLAVELARLYIPAGNLERAGELINGLPREIRESDEGKNLQALVEFAGAAADSNDTASLEDAVQANPQDSQSRYRLAARQILEADYDAALINLLELLKRDRNYADNAAQRGLLTVFSLLGEGDERITQYRRKMASLLL